MHIKDGKEFELILDKDWYRGPKYKNKLHKLLCKIFPQIFEPIYSGDVLNNGRYKLTVMSNPVKYTVPFMEIFHTITNGELELSISQIYVVGGYTYKVKTND